MSAKHVVAQGEHITGIAEKYGFRDFHIIWDYPDNAPLKKERVNPHVLYPGDTVVIPDKTIKNLFRPTGKKHSFRVASQPLMLRIALKDFDNQPIASMPCVLRVGGATYKLVSDADGIIETPIRKDAAEGVLTVPDLDIEHALKIGSLDPLAKESGWQGRLVNLGYFGGAVGDEDTEQLHYAIEEFQCDHALKVTGELDDVTRAALKREHGS